MKSNDIHHIAIVGAGLVGTVMALYLIKRGYKVSLFERRSDPRLAGAEHGRSINLALSNRGWKALQEIGIEKSVEDIVIPMKGRMMHDERGLLTFQPYGIEGQAINSVSRGGLNILLLDKAENAGIRLLFEMEVQHIDFEMGSLYVKKHDEPFYADLIIGADGAYSVIRNQMQKTDRFNYSQFYIDYGYKELSIPAGPEGKHKIEKNALHIWPRGKFMLIALPNLDGSYTCTIFLPFNGDDSFEYLKTKENIILFFQKYFPDAKQLLPDLINEFESNPTSSLVTIRCFPWTYKRALIIGDASHGIVPFYGQGMNSGFEDCRILNNLLNKYDDQWDLVLPEFEELRKPDADAIANLALKNFVEMRDLVADDQFLLRKKIEARLHQEFPREWIPLYSMVTFREDMRYSEALKKGIFQDEIMQSVMNDPHINEKWETMPLQPIIERLRKGKMDHAPIS